jgi:hypothetical protein
VDEIDQILRSARVIAVVGLSDRPDRPSYSVAAYMRDAGYEVIPVNPRLDNWEGLTCWPSVEAIGRPVDLVNVFRRPEHCAEVTRGAVRARAAAVWLQLGITSDEAARIAREAGLVFVQNRCLAVEHQRRIAMNPGEQP